MRCELLSAVKYIGKFRRIGTSPALITAAILSKISDPLPLPPDPPVVPERQASRGRKRHQPVSFNSPSPVILPNAALSVLQELSYTTTGGLFEAIQHLLLIDDVSISDVPIPSTNQTTFQLSQRHHSTELSNSDPNHSNPMSPNFTSSLRQITQPGEVHRRLSKLQWIGFLAQQVHRTGPTGRHVVTELDRYLPRWDSQPSFGKGRELNHALELDRETFTNAVAEAVGLASSVIDGRDWAEDKLLLVRSLYPGEGCC